MKCIGYELYRSTEESPRDGGDLNRREVHKGHRLFRRVRWLVGVGEKVEELASRH